MLMPFMRVIPGLMWMTSNENMTCRIHVSAVLSLMTVQDASYRKYRSAYSSN